MLSRWPVSSHGLAFCRSMGSTDDASAPLATWKEFDYRSFYECTGGFIWKPTQHIDLRLSGSDDAAALEAFQRLSEPSEGPMSGLFQGKSSFEISSLIFQCGEGFGETVYERSVLEFFFPGHEAPPVPPEDERKTILLMRRPNLALVALQITRQLFPALRSMAIAASRTMSLFSPSHRKPEENEFQMAHHLASLMVILNNFAMASDAVSKRLAHDHAFVEAVLLSIEVALSAIMFAEHPWPSKYLLLFTRPSQLLFQLAGAHPNYLRRGFVQAYPNGALGSTADRIGPVVDKSHNALRNLMSEHDTAMCLHYIALPLDCLTHAVKHLRHISEAAKAKYELLERIKEVQRQSHIDRGIDYDVCDGCGKVETDDVDLKRCSRCRVGRFCSSECQKQQWQEHKKRCFDASIIPTVDAAARVAIWGLLPA